MARSEKGTARKLRLWLQRMKPSADDEVTLTTSQLGEAVVLSRWKASECNEDAAWETFVFDLAQANADEQGRAVLYAVRLVRGEKQLGQYDIKCKGVDDEEEARRRDAFDGSPESLVKGLYGQNTKLLDNLLSSQSAAIGPLVKTIDALHARMVVLEKERGEQADEIHRLKLALAEAEARVKPDADDEAEAMLMQRAGKLVEMFGPQILHALSNLAQSSGTKN